MIKQLKRWVNGLLVMITAFYAAALVLPYHPDPALANQYHLCSNEANFVITADRRLVAWDIYDDHHVTPGMPFKPYFLRKTVIRNAAQVQTSYAGGMALDRSGTLWGWGVQGLLVPEEERESAWSFSQPVKLMEDVQDFSIVEFGCGAAILKTDGSFWVWGKYYRCPKPMLMAEDVQKIGPCLRFIDGEGTCWKFEHHALEDQPPDHQRVWVADGVAACAARNQFYLLTTGGVLRTEGSEKPIAEGVTALRTDGYFCKDGAWFRFFGQGTKEEVVPLEEGLIYSGWSGEVITSNGRICIPGRLSFPKNLYAVSPLLRNLFLLALVVRSMLNAGSKKPDTKMSA